MATTESATSTASQEGPGVDLVVKRRGHDEAVAWITVRNPRRLNILNTPVLERFASCLEQVRADDELRGLVLTGAGDRAFIGGADIREMVDLDPTTARQFITRLHRVCHALRSLPIPVVARIHGYCLGAGLEVAAACDLRVATEASQFGMPEVQVGVPSVIEAALLPQLVGWGKTRELVFTGRMMSSAEAAGCGLVERVVAREDLDTAVGEWVDAILNAGPRAIRLQKALIGKWEELPLQESIACGIESFSEAYKTDEPRVSMRRFLERPRK